MFTSPFDFSCCYFGKAQKFVQPKDKRSTVKLRMYFVISVFEKQQVFKILPLLTISNSDWKKKIHILILGNDITQFCESNYEKNFYDIVFSSTQLFIERAKIHRYFRLFIFCNTNFNYCYIILRNGIWYIFQ